MDFTAAARGIVAGIKIVAGPEMRETLDTINAGLETVDRGVRVAGGVLDTIERGVGIGRDLLGAWHRSGGAGSQQAAPADAANAAGAADPAPFKSAAERGDELLRQAREDAEYDRMLAYHQKMQRQTQSAIGLARDRQDTIDRLRRGGSGSSMSSGSFSRF